VYNFERDAILRSNKYPMICTCPLCTGEGDPYCEEEPDDDDDYDYVMGDIDCEKEIPY
jgi:hypothetical protein